MGAWPFSRTACPSRTRAARMCSTPSRARSHAAPSRRSWAPTARESPHSYACSRASGAPRADASRSTNENSHHSTHARGRAGSRMSSSDRRSRSISMCAVWSNSDASAPRARAGPWMRRSSASLSVTRRSARSDRSRSGSDSASRSRAHGRSSRDEHQLSTLGALRELARRGLGVGVVIHDLTLATRTSDHALVLARDGSTDSHGTRARVLTPGTLTRVFGVPFASGVVEGQRVMTPIGGPRAHPGSGR